MKINLFAFDCDKFIRLQNDGDVRRLKNLIIEINENVVKKHVK